MFESVSEYCPKRPLRMLVAVLVIVLAFVLPAFGVSAWADEQPSSDGGLQAQAIDSGEWGTCSWNVTNNVLTIEPTDGNAGTLKPISYDSAAVNSNAPWYAYSGDITKVVIKEGVSAGSSAALFTNFFSLTEIDGLEYLDTSGVTNMSGMFAHCESLETIALPANFITSGCTDTSNMFIDCLALKTLTGFESGTSQTTSNVRNMSNMFLGCKSLSALDISQISTASATSMSGFFDGCSLLSKVTVGSGFSFKGSGNTILCTLPTIGNQQVANATGNWNVERGGKSQGVYTVDALADKFNGAAAVYTVETISGSQVVYRLFNPSTGEHLFTTAVHEVNVVSGSWGWTYEGSGWVAPAPSSETLPVFRLFQASTNQHLYTTDTNEMRVLTTQYGWVYDNNGQPLFYSGGDIPIYRLFNVWSLQHHYTTSSNENSVLPTKGWGWQQEGQKLSCVSLGNSSYPYPTE